MQSRKMRLLRQKHRLSLTELSRHGNISPQRLSQIELGSAPVTMQMQHRVETAFSRLITERRKVLAELDSDFNAHRNSLLDFTDGTEEHP